MSNIANSSVYTPFLTAQKYVRLRDDNVTQTFFVATTGSNSNNGLSALTPFLTIQKAIDTIAGSLESGNVLINVADGTYAGDVLLKDIVGKNDGSLTGGAFTSNQAYGPNYVEIRGNTATPSSVIVVGTGTVNGTFLAPNLSTYYKINGFEVRNDNTATNFAFFVDNSKMSIQNCSSAQVGYFLFAQNYAYVNLEISTAGMVHAVKNGFITAYNLCLIETFQNITCTGIAGRCFSSYGGSEIYEYGSAYGTATVFSFTGVGAVYFLEVLDTSVIQGFSGVTVATSGFSTFMREFGNGQIIIYGGCTFNVTDSPGGFLGASDASIYSEYSANTWNELGTTANSYAVNDDSKVFTLNGFGGAAASYGVGSTGYKYGRDGRYYIEVMGTHSGALPLGTTAYFGQGSLQASYISLYTAFQDEQVIRIYVRMETANGAAHTDTFTLVKNGVDTGLTVSITNGSTGTAVTPLISLVALDSIGLKAVTGAATAGANVIAEVLIIKI